MSDFRGKLSGVFVPMVTPFRNDEILYAGIRQNVEKWNVTGLRGYFVLGTNGEYKSLSVTERFRVLDTVVRSSASDKIIMAGCGAESTRETLDLVREAAYRGASMASLLMPSFFAKSINEDVMVRFIVEVADHAPIPVVLYNNPAVAAGVTITHNVLRRVKDHPNVMGIKDSSKDTYKENLKASSEKFFVLAGSANYFLDLLENGGTGGVLSLANVFPDACVRLYRAFVEGKKEEAKRLNETLVTLNKAVSGTFGVAGVKAAMDLAGYIGGVPRRPLLELTDAQKESLRNTLKDLGFLK